MVLLFGGLLLPSHGREEKVLSLHGHGSFIIHTPRGFTSHDFRSEEDVPRGTCVAFIVGIKFEGHGPKTDTS